MSWNSAAEFFAMGGYGLYVWGSFVLTAVCLILEPLLLRRRRCAALTQLQRGLALTQDFSNEKSS